MTDINDIYLANPLTELDDADLLYIGADPGGTPADGAISKSDLFTQIGNLTGWNPGSGTWAYVSADDPIFVMNVPDAQAALMNIGDRIKLTQTTVKYFIIHAIGSPSGGNTPIIIYGGTDYNLANAAITLPYWSHAKSPVGFSLLRSKWSVTASNTGNAKKTSPTNDIWYGGAGLSVTGISISAPIGAWELSFRVITDSQLASSSAIFTYTTLSTANNSESNPEYTVIAYRDPIVRERNQLQTFHRNLVAAAKTTWYLNIKTSTSSVQLIAQRGDILPTTIELVSAYL